MIDLHWTAEARADVEQHGLTFAEVVEVIDDEASVQVHVGEGPARIMFLGAGQPGRVIVVTVDRQARTLNIYDINEVRPATGGEVRAWKKRQP